MPGPTPAPDDDALAAPRQRLIDKLLRHSRSGEVLNHPALPSLITVRQDEVQSSVCGVYDPCVALVVQGRKSVDIGDRTLVYDAHSCFVTPLDLPGVARDDVKVSVDGRQVTLEAQAKSTQEKKDGERTVYRERSEVSYSRSFTLPVEVDEAASQAKLDNGVLTLTLAKKVAPGASRITVN